MTVRYILVVLSLALASSLSGGSPRFVLENLGANVNSPYEEYRPVVSADGRTLYFVRSGHPENAGPGLDIWSSVKDAEGRWTKAVRLPKPLNNKRNNGVLAVSADNNRLLLSQVSSDPSVLLSIAVRSEDGWVIQSDVVIADYYNKSRYFDFCLSQDNRFLIAAIERSNSLGGQDLYVSFLEEGARYGIPLHLGRTINTPRAEFSPFLAADDRTLYFTSYGHPGKGGGDVFMSRRLDDTWTNWSRPENLGEPVNTPSLDACFSISASGEEGYLVSRQNSLGEGDIFSVTIPAASRPAPVVLVTGRVLNRKSNKPLRAEIRTYDLVTDEEIGKAVSDPQSGRYNIILQSGRTYSFRADVAGFFAINENLDLSELKNYREVKKDLLLVPVEKGQTIRLNNVFFDTGRADLKAESRAELQRLVLLLRENSGLRIIVEGHTDAMGEGDANLRLSEERARAVLQYLLSNGVASDRMRSRGYGSRKPLRSNDTEEGRALNRRVEFTIAEEK